MRSSLLSQIWRGVGGVLAPGRYRGVTTISHQLTILFDL
jgi:hypothetical protein